MFAAAFACARLFPAVTNRVISAANGKSFSVDQYIRKLIARVVINALHRRACDIHLRGAFFLRKTHQIDEANRFIFIDRHNNGAFSRTISRWPKGYVPRHAADSAAFSRPWHIALPRNSALATRVKRTSAETLLTVYYYAASPSIAHIFRLGIFTSTPNPECNRCFRALCSGLTHENSFIIVFSHFAYARSNEMPNAPWKSVCPAQ